MRLCEAQGCVGTAVALVKVKAPGWNVAESRRVCAHHRTELTQQREETPMPKKAPPKKAPPMTDAPQFPSRVQYLEMDSRKYSETLAILRAVVMELDEWHTEDMVDHMGAPELVAALRRFHQETVARWKAKADRLEEEVTAAQARLEERGTADKGERMLVAAAATVAARAADEMEPWASERDATVGMMLRAVVDALETVND